MFVSHFTQLHWLSSIVYSENKGIGSSLEFSLEKRKRFLPSSFYI